MSIAFHVDFNHADSILKPGLISSVNGDGKCWKFSPLESFLRP